MKYYSQSPFFLTIATSMLFISTHTFAQSSPAKPLDIVVSPVVSREGFGETLEALGTTQANESVEITSNITEFVRAIHFDDGDTVKKGDLLIELENAEESSALKSAKALMKERRAAFDRATELVQQQALSTATLEEREALLLQIEGQIEGLEAQLQDRIIRAPFDGVLGLREISPGALVTAGQLITTLDDLSEIKVDFDVPSLFLSVLHPGLPIEGRADAYPDEEFSGSIRTLSSRIDPVTRTIMVRALIPNEELRLRPGLLMSIQLTKNPRTSLIIPEGAVVQRADKSFVFEVVEIDGQTVTMEREVKLGTRIPGEVELLSGLDGGALVVVHGLMQVRSNLPVNVLGVKKGDEPLASFLKPAAE
ncbi:efflux RND transporter periplasmic adaptor subunit [Kiritimatiellota bacterium B12222]|nr:efflux RND transporter periplasmic adaptor subunit [Kiritimatiellota bacterium B12222]